MDRIIKQAKASSKLETLIEVSDVNEHSRIVFEKPPSLKVLESLLVAIYEESKDYRIWPVSPTFDQSRLTLTSLGK